MTEYKFKSRKCICGLALSGKNSNKVREGEDGLVGLCPRCERDIPISVPRQSEPVEEPESVEE